MTTTATTNLLDLDRAGLTGFFAEQGEKSFRATQVMKWIYGQGVTDFEAMTNISKRLRAELQQRACIDLPTVASDSLSADGSRKWLLEMTISPPVKLSRKYWWRRWPLVRRRMANAEYRMWS